MRNINLADLTISKFYGVVESVLNHDHGEFWLMGGRASLKSSVISLLIVCLIVAFPWANAVVVRRFGNTLRDSVYAQIIWAIDILGLSSFFHARVSPMEIVYVPTGQKIVFRGMDDPLKMKGVKFVKGYCAIQWFEELDQGSSPRMRGTLRPAQRLRGVLGIIPAYAGNTKRLRQRMRSLRDHPRVCGEHLAKRNSPRRTSGSSPRMRGTPVCDGKGGLRLGIIPAYAGNTAPWAPAWPSTRDHPRVCGEHSISSSTSSGHPGSSPRMRGTPFMISWYSFVPGIIPAYAGNTVQAGAERRFRRDHPRVCGEHRLAELRIEHDRGSSPRMRGTLDVGSEYTIMNGIIPAYAGNTTSRQSISAARRDHPRVCGEHSETFRNIVDAAGSSPRMRGTLQQLSDQVSSTGIIPAYAGNTKMAKTEGGVSRDHPRVCGEHLSVSLMPMQRQGSSPRMRGTLEH